MAKPEWNPAEPLEDDEEEEQCQATAKMRARTDYLKAQLDSKRPESDDPKKKKRKIEF
jgi:hypothetical protein